MPTIELPLSILIRERSQELKLGRSELVARCGYKNISKGLRRLDQVYAGDLDKAIALLKVLHKALDLPPEIVERAIDATIQQIAAEADAAWRASFRPTAYLLGTSSRPSQIWAFGVTGGVERWLKIPLDLTESPISYAQQALAVVRRTTVVRFFGPTTGFVVNYTPDNAVRFDLEGRPVEKLTRAYQPGEVTLYLGRQAVPAVRLGRMLSTWPMKPSHTYSGD
jgi:hypothetical protein